MDVRVGLWRKLSTEELMLLNCGVGEDSWESLGQQDQISQSYRKWTQIFIGRNDAEAPIILPPDVKIWLIRKWCWERLKAEGEGDDRGWDGWMASPTQWTWVWASSGSWWWTGKPGVLQSMGSQRIGHDWATELNWWRWDAMTAGIRGRKKSKAGLWTLNVDRWNKCEERDAKHTPGQLGQWFKSR